MIHIPRSLRSVRSDRNDGGWGHSPRRRLLHLPVRLRGIQLGRPVDLLLEADTLARARLRRALPATSRTGSCRLRRPSRREDEIQVGSSLLLLEDVAFYRAPGHVVPQPPRRRGPAERPPGRAGSATCCSQAARSPSSSSTGEARPGSCAFPRPARWSCPRGPPRPDRYPRVPMKRLSPLSRRHGAAGPPELGAAREVLRRRCGRLCRSTSSSTRRCSTSASTIWSPRRGRSSSP